MTDEDLMARAIELARTRVGRTGDNPSVGCVIAKDGAIVGEGVTGEGGRPHAEEQALDAAGKSIPLAWASNFSLGVAVLHELVARAAQALPGWDCDIIEAHHVRKQDAPSGTAVTLGQSVEAGGATPRFASIRAGDIVGEHKVQFTGPGERVELVHRAGNRDIFARGALHAASRLVGRAPGVYGIRDLL